MHRKGIPAEDEGGVGENFFFSFAPEPVCGNTEKTVRFVCPLSPAFHGIKIDAGTGAVHEEVTFFKGFFKGFFTFNDGEGGEIGKEHFPHSPVDLAGPEPYFLFWYHLLRQRKKSGGMGDVTDISGLPAAPEQYVFDGFHERRSLLKF